MTDEQIKEVMRLSDEVSGAVGELACSTNESETYESIDAARAALKAYLSTIGEPESVNAELLDALKECMKWQAEGEFGDPLSEEYWSPAYKEFMGKTKEAIARAESAIETPAKVSPCAGHAEQQEADEAIGLAQALEQHRARKIVDAVSALPVGGKHEYLPSPFHAGYQLACEEVMHRLLTEEWDGCMTPPGQRESDDLVGLRGCNRRHGGMRAVEPCGYRMRTTDPGCTGCVERDEDQPTKAGD